MNISLPDSLKSFVDKRVAQGGYASSSEYVRELIRMDQARAELREKLLAGKHSGPAEPVDDAMFEHLRTHARRVAAENPASEDAAP